MNQLHKRADGKRYDELDLGEVCVELGQEAEAVLQYDLLYRTLDKCQTHLTDALTVAEAGILGREMHRAEIMKNCTTPRVQYLQRRFNFLRDGGEVNDPFWDE